MKDRTSLIGIAIVLALYAAPSSSSYYTVTYLDAYLCGFCHEPDILGYTGLPWGTQL
jgi:hypothetical protein